MLGVLAAFEGSGIRWMSSYLRQLGDDDSTFIAYT